MNKLERLIAKLCPNGVEYRPLGEIGEFFSGMTGVTNKWAETGNCRFIDYMNVYKNPRVDVGRLETATVKKANQFVLKKGDVLFTAASEKPEECAIAGEIEDDIAEGVFADDHLFGVRVNAAAGVAKGYLKYVCQAPVFRSQVKKYVRGVTRFYIAKKEFMGIEIPLPPLAFRRRSCGCWTG